MSFGRNFFWIEISIMVQLEMMDRDPGIESWSAQCELGQPP